MTLTHHSHLAAALLGTALLSCAGGGAREDNQAPRPHEPRFVQVERGPPAHDGVLAVAPRWRGPMGPQDAPVQRLRIRPGTDGAVLLSQDGFLDPKHQGGPLLGVKVDRSNDGLRVTEVVETSLAQSAGVKVDDVLLRIGDEHINDVADVRRALHGKQPGDQVKVAVIRAGEGIVELTGTVPEPPADSADATGDQQNSSGMGSADGSRGGFLGIELKETDEPADASAAGPREPGLLIEGVVPNSAAWFAGLDPQDRLLSIDGQALTSRADLVGAVASKEPGSLVELKYVRAGQEHTATVRLGRRGPMHLFGDLQGLQGLRGLNGLQSLQDLQGLGDLRVHRLPGMDLSHVRRLDPDQGDLTNLLGDLQLQPGTSGSLQVEIDGDRMTIERDGKTEHYMRDADGQWQPADGSVDGSASQSRA